MNYAKDKAVVFGLFETGLGVIRSLGQEKIKVTGVDFKKDIGWYSKYVEPKICPHPLKQEKEFLNWITTSFSNENKTPAFITGDDFLMCFSANRVILQNYFLFNLPEEKLLNAIADKKEQYELVRTTGINIPGTIVIRSAEELETIILNDLKFPVFVKGLNVNSWRERISGSIKGFEINALEELKGKVSQILKKEVSVIIQELVIGSDTSHYKYCAYVNDKGEFVAEFVLQKIRQRPIHYGVGSAVESVINNELVHLGRKLFSGINLKGIGSAEFKKDERDGNYKLIEINPRYWQQNYLPTACGLNFPLINYSDLIGKTQNEQNKYRAGIKWVSRFADLDSYLGYRKEGLSFIAWRRSLKGKKVYSDFTWDDPFPLFYEIEFGLKLFKAPWFLFKRIIKK